jgi:hypothetical protein
MHAQRYETPLPTSMLRKLGTGCKDTPVICNSTFMALVI